MKIYFTGQLYRKSEYIKEYTRIVEYLTEKGHIVLQDTLESQATDILNQTQEQLDTYYKTYFHYLTEADCCVADVSFPSTVNIGFDVSNVLNKGVPVIALYRKGEDPKFISPNYSTKMIKAEYTLTTIDTVLDWALAEVELLLSRRFTFFIDSKIDKYLDKVCKKDNTNKSDYLRNLVYEDIKKRAL